MLSFNNLSVMGRARTVLWLAFLAMLAFVLLMPLFEAPFERDQGTYATIARGWMDGALPYRDLWDNKGPLLFLWYVASFAGLGESIAAPRIAAALAAALSVPFVWSAAKRLFGPKEALLAAGLYALSFSNLYLQAAANAEIFMLLPMTAGFWAFAMGARDKGNLWYLVAGMLTSLSVFTRQSAIMTFGAYGAWLAGVYLKNPLERKRQIAAAGALALGAVSGALPFVVYFASHGLLYDLWFAMFGFNFGWAAEQSFWLKFVPPLFIEPGPLAGGLIFWVLALTGIWKLWQLKDRAAWLVLAYLAFSEAAAQAMGKGSAHYSIQLLPGAAIAAAFGLLHIQQWWRTGTRILKAGLAVAAAITLASILFVYLQPTARDRFMVQYTYRDYADDAVQAPAIARRVAGLSLPGECVYEWGRSSQIYFLAERHPCSRLFYNRPYEVDVSMAEEVMRDLRQRKPAVILITGDIAPPAELEKLLQNSYRDAGRVEYARLYARTKK